MLFLGEHHRDGVVPDHAEQHQVLLAGLPGGFGAAERLLDAQPLHRVQQLVVADQPRQPPVVVGLDGGLDQRAERRIRLDREQFGVPFQHPARA